LRELRRHAQPDISYVLSPVHAGHQDRRVVGHPDLWLDWLSLLRCVNQLAVESPRARGAAAAGRRRDFYEETATVASKPPTATLSRLSDKTVIAASFRLHHAEKIGVPPVRTLDDICKLGEHVHERGFTAPHCSPSPGLV
jgi:hypothetical protein